MRRSKVLVLGALAAIPIAALASETITYTYDVHGRLVKVEHEGGVNDNRTVEYTLDKADNRDQVNVTDPSGP